MNNTHSYEVGIGRYDVCAASKKTESHSFYCGCLFKLVAPPVSCWCPSLIKFKSAQMFNGLLVCELPARPRASFVSPTASPSARRAPQAPERRDMPPVQQKLRHHQFGRRHRKAVGPEDGRIHPEPGDAGERGQRRRGVAHPGLQHQAGVRGGQPQRHRGDQAAGAGL